MAKKNLNTYLVSAKLEVEADIEIKGESLEDALSQARDLTVLDFIEFKNTYIDGEHKIVSIYEFNG